MKTALVLGAGGFIGSHMVKRLRSEGYWVRGVDLLRPEFSKSEANEFLIYDLRSEDNVRAVMSLYKPDGAMSPTRFNYLRSPYVEPFPFDEVYQFAADMGGAGYIFTGEHDADLMHNSALINLHVCKYAIECKVGKVFYSSSACIYPQDIQRVSDNPGLEESDAYPADPDSEYGWEKLFSERLYLSFARNHGLDIRIARFHNIFGPEGTYKGGREKAPAAICRKVIEEKDSIEIWGDGTQTRSFLYIDECIEAVKLLMESDYKDAINIGSDEIISINDLAEMVMDISQKILYIKNVYGPKGVQGRNSDNKLINKTLEYSPSMPLKEGIEKTYEWIKSQIDGVKS